MNKLINVLKEKKTIPLDQFIDITLYDKKFGYYMKKNPFGKEGDFITSPLISNLFGEMVAIWCISFWEYLGKPKKISIIELGSGDGSLCSTLLKTFEKFKTFNKCLEIKLLEKSPFLKKIQKEKIKGNKVKWIEKVDQINSGPIIFIANEFFDALPIKQIFKNKEKFFEKHVTLTRNEKIKFLYKKANPILIEKIKNNNLNANNGLIEYPLDAINYLKIIAKKINKFNGGLLCFDYGYLKKKNKSSLQSVMKHKYINIFSSPGGSDITSHINYELFSNILNTNGLNVQKIVTQNEFLQKVGIIERANILSKKMNFKDKSKMFFKLKKLLHNDEMGNIFKVMFAQKKINKFNVGF